jgi:hypothetical protein
MPAQIKPRHKRPTPSRARQGVALGVTTVVSAGAVIGGAGAAQAATTPISQSKGIFLSGSALGVDLDSIVKINSAAAVNTGSPATVTQLNPLGVTLLNSLNVPLGPVNLLKGNGLLTLGAVNQAAIARSNGSAIGASGAVSDSGAIAVGGKDGVPASTAKLDLGGLLASSLGTNLVGGLVDADLSVGAISANATQATGVNGNQVGHYNIASLKLNLQSPLLAGLLSGLNLGSQQSQLTGLTGSLNALPLSTLLGPVLGLLGTSNPTLTATNIPNLANIVAAQDLTLGSNGVTVDLANGKITVDVEALLKSLGLDLNNLPPNTEIVKLILDAVTKNVTNLAKGAVQKLKSDITAAVNNITVTGSATGLGLPLLTPLGTVVPISLTSITPQIDGVLNPVLDTVLTPVQSLLGSVTGPLLDPLFNALEKVLSIRVNVQNKSGGAFTERAIQIRVLPNGAGVNTTAVNDSLATVNLATAIVGPGAGVAGTSTGSGTPTGDGLPATGAGESAPLAAAGIALMLAGSAAAAGAGRMGSRSGSAAAHAGARGRGSSGGGRHKR